MISDFFRDAEAGASNSHRGIALNEPESIRTILKRAKTIAVVGLSDKPSRPSFSVSRYMQQAGYRIIPVHPTVTKVPTWWTYSALPNMSRKSSKT
jgi:predicted CoA-binding protein